MAKLVFPTVGPPYRGFVGEVRGWLQRIASYGEKDPGSVSVLRAQINSLATYLSARIVDVGEAISLRTSTGIAYTPAVNGNFLLAGDLVTKTIRLPSTALVAQSGTKITIPAPTGAYVNGITLTIVNGAVTAAVLS